MTCVEFKHDAAALTLQELSQRRDERLVSHVQQCESCGGWLQEQRSLAASLQTLQARTAGLQASPAVERSVLQAFRQSNAKTPALEALEPDSLQHVRLLKPLVRYASAPFALRLSRFFEVGAYVAVAAAMLVGMSLGFRLLQHSPRTVPVQARTAPDSTRPSVQKPVAAVPLQTALGQHQQTSAGRSRAEGVRSLKRASAAAQSAADDSQTDSNDGYIALMFCDPLSCSSDAQVVRMELPGNAAGGSQPQIADLVVGYDGVVRAIRIVN